MVGVARLVNIIRTCYVSNYLCTDRPISVMLIADADHGKSQLILQSISKEAIILSNVTSKGLFDVVKKNHDAFPDRPIVLVIPDFNSVVERKATTASATISNLLSLLQEGTMQVADGGGTIDLKGVKASLITAMTPGIAKTRAHKWRKQGFLRRFIPIFYSYSDCTAKEIHESIRSGRYREELDTTVFKMPKEKKFVKIPDSLSKAIHEYSIFIAERIEHRGFTVHKHFRSYVKARALMRGSQTATDKDLDSLKDCGEFVRLDKPNEI